MDSSWKYREQELIARGIQRRAELPQRRLHGGDRTDVAGDSIDCERFVKQGACRIFNELGRCNFHHPLDVHTVEIPPQRCPQVPNYLHLLVVLIVPIGPGAALVQLGVKDMDIQNRLVLKATGTPFILPSC